jgi:hypothetical protein
VRSTAGPVPKQLGSCACADAHQLPLGRPAHPTAARLDRYKSWRAENPRCFGTAVEQVLRDEATAKHKKRVRTARASLQTTHADSRLAEYATFRARLREARLAKTVGFSKRESQRVVEHPPWRPNSPKPKRRPSSAPAAKRSGGAPKQAWQTRVATETAGKLAEVITQAGLVPDDAAATAALANMLAEDQRQLNSEVEVAEGAKDHVDAVREQQRLYMEAMEAGATAEEAEAAATAMDADADAVREQPSATGVVQEQSRRAPNDVAPQHPVETAAEKIWTGTSSVDYPASGDHVELKAYKSPPPTVKMVMEAVCLVLGMAPTWEAAKALLGKGTELSNTLSSLQVDSVSKATLRKLKKSYIGKPSLDYVTAAKTSKAVCSLCLWVNNVYRAATGQEQLAPPAPPQPVNVKRKGGTNKKKRPASAGAGGSRGGSPSTESKTSTSKRAPKKAAKRSSKKSHHRAAHANSAGKQQQQQQQQQQAHAPVGLIDPNDLVGTVSAAVQNGLSGDDLLRLCESLGQDSVELASSREVRTNCHA